MSLEPIDLLAPIRTSMRIAAAEFERRGVVLDPLPAADGEVRVRGDAAALEQLFLNLLLNAAQAGESGARAGVRVDSATHEITVTVWDTGPGFAKDADVRAFDPFFTTKVEGTGLGLTVARRIAIAHGGAIALATSPGGGTEVRVTLPPV
jgi:signal transduction histidine kinase